MEKIEKELQECEEEIPLEGPGTKIEVLASQKFVKDVSEKTGMSHRQIFQAIERDEKASAEIKKARSEGDLSIGQTNEVIKLTKGEQKKILPVIKDKTVKEIRKIVKEAKANGIDTAVNNCLEEDQQAKEVKQLKQLMKKMTTYNCGKCGECEFEVLNVYDGKTLCYNCRYRREKVLEMNEFCQ